MIVNVDIAVKIIRGNMKMLGAYVAHTGIALFILGVIGSAVYSEQVDIELIKNTPKSAFGYEMTFTEIYPIENNRILDNSYTIIDIVDNVGNSVEMARPSETYSIQFE